MDNVLYLKALFALLCVLTAMMLLVFALRNKWLQTCLLGRNEHDRRIFLKDSLVIDQKRRLVLIKCDNIEHLILLGKDNDVILSTKAANENIANK